MSAHDGPNGPILPGKLDEISNYLAGSLGWLTQSAFRMRHLHEENQRLQARIDTMEAFIAEWLEVPIEGEDD